MPNKLAKSKKRVSYAEDRETLEQLMQISRKEKRTLTALIREAVTQYLLDQEKRDKKTKAP